MFNQFIKPFKSAADAKRERICLHVEQFDVVCDLAFFHGLFIDASKVSFNISNIPGTIRTKEG